MKSVGQGGSSCFGGCDAKVAAGARSKRSGAGDPARSLAAGPGFWPVGWGFLTAWGVCLFFTDALSADILSSRISWLASLAATSVGLTILALLPRCAGRIKVGGVATLGASLAVCLGTLAFGLLPPDAAALRVGGVACAGIGMAVLNVAWGRAYMAMDVADIESNAIRSVVPPAICYLIVLVLPAGLGVALTAVLPLISGALLYVGGRWAAGVSHDLSDTGEGADCGPLDQTMFSRSWLRLGLGVFGAAVLIAMLWTFERMSYAEQSPLSYSVAGAGGIILAGIVVALYFFWARRLSTGTFYRIICPVIAVGYLCTSFASAAGSLVAYGASFLAQTMFDVVVWAYLAERAMGRDAEGLRIISVGRLLQQCGLLTGFVLSLPLESFLAERAVAFGSLSTLAVVALLCVAMFVMGDDELQVRGHGENSARVSGGGQGGGDAGTGGVGSFEQRCRAVCQCYGLSPRESEVLSYLAKGHSLPYIRNELFISKGTIDTHTRHIYKKCGVHSREELIDLVDTADS